MSLEYSTVRSSHRPRSGPSHVPSVRPPSLARLRPVPPNPGGGKECPHEDDPTLAVPERIRPARLVGRCWRTIERVVWLHGMTLRRGRGQCRRRPER